MKDKVKGNVNNEALKGPIQLMAKWDRFKFFWKRSRNDWDFV